MNKTAASNVPTDRQAAYLRHLAGRAHDAGMPHLDIHRFTRAQAHKWIDYLRLVVDAEERVRETLDHAKEAAEQQDATPHLLTPPHTQIPSTYRPPYDPLPPAEDHEHLVGRIQREDGIEESVCVLCGVSA